MESSSEAENETQIQEGAIENDPNIYQTLDEQQTEALDQQTEQQQAQEIEVQDRVFFGYNAFEVSDEAKKILDVQAAWLKSDPTIKITIEGHCDERGTREYNIALGEKRANSVKKYLVANGVENKRIKIISYGKERPAFFGATDEIFNKNRRAVTVVN
ncbi:MAG: peptidoglycan-associated lipoprotein Pal [Proteobacteria bacterium]|nr:peptidoglycan-associated lipoprotein Pal [Pseudomonadota bacterium]